MENGHQSTGRMFWESYVLLSIKLKKDNSNILVINLGGDDPHLLTLPGAVEFAKEAAKKEGFNTLIKIEEDIRVYGQNNLAERMYYFKKEKKVDGHQSKKLKKERKEIENTKKEDRFDENAQVQVIFPNNKIEEDKKIKETGFIIFYPRPENWGLRGDPYLWMDLEKEFRPVELPCSKNYFIKHFEECFEKLTNQRFRTRKYVEIYVERYDNGGMSNGQVSMRYWRKVGLPLLLQRLEEVCKKY